MKECSRCKRIRARSAFSRNINKKDGLNYECKECQVLYFREYYKANRQAHIQRVANSRCKQYEPDLDIPESFFALRYKVRYFLKAKKRIFLNKRWVQKRSWRQSLTFKIKRFRRGCGGMKFSTQDVLDKFGETPKCYLTGIQLDLKDPSCFELDHIIPKCKDGPNTLDNLGICCPDANRAKNGMELDDFIKMCKAIADNFT